jgi:hypothetical protein
MYRLWSSLYGAVHPIAPTGTLIDKSLVSTPDNHAVLRCDELCEIGSDPLEPLTELARTGILALGNRLMCCQLLVSMRHQENSLKQRTEWNSLLTLEGSHWLRFATQTGTITPSIPLEDWLTEMELLANLNQLRRGPNKAFDRHEFFYVAQISTKASDRGPESMIARI